MRDLHRANRGQRDLKGWYFKGTVKLRREVHFSKACSGNEHNTARRKLNTYGRLLTYHDVDYVHSVTETATLRQYYVNIYIPIEFW